MRLFDNSEQSFASANLSSYRNLTTQLRSRTLYSMVVRIVLSFSFWIWNSLNRIPVASDASGTSRSCLPWRWDISQNRQQRPHNTSAEKRFREGWKHQDKTYHLESIYYINQAGPEAQKHLAQNRAYLWEWTISPYYPCILTLDVHPANKFKLIHLGQLNSTFFMARDVLVTSVMIATIWTHVISANAASVISSSVHSIYPMPVRIVIEVR